MLLKDNQRNVNFSKGIMNATFFAIMTCICLAFGSLTAFTQNKTDTILQQPSLAVCVQYALQHFPQIQQAAIDEAITEQQIKSKLSEWYPQIGLSANYQNNFQLQPAYFAGSIIKNGTYNSSFLGISGTQNIFDRDVLLATKSARDVRQQIRQTTTSDKIDLSVNVSKAFYDVLLTQKQIELVDEDILRLERSQKDTYNQYRAGWLIKQITNVQSLHSIIPGPRREPRRNY